MSNRYNQRRQILRRPPVCKAPPPPPAPPEPADTVQTDCCLQPIPTHLDMEIYSSNCPSNVGVTAAFEASPGPAQPWQGVITLPDNGGILDTTFACIFDAGAFHWRASCVDQYANMFDSGNSDANLTCDPFSVEVSLNIHQDDVPDSCAPNRRTIRCRFTA
jgi:hypothetical protein